jgi:hypothetical protein
MLHRVLRRLGVLAASGAVVSCADGPTRPAATPDGPPPTLLLAADAGGSIAAVLDRANLVLETQGASYRAGLAEFITPATTQEAGTTVLSRALGNRRLGEDFVPRDPRRTWSGPAPGSDDITHAIDRTADAAPPGGGLTEAETTPAIRRAMATWDAVACSTLPITEVPDFGLDLGVAAFLNGLGGGPFIVADLMHAGWGDVDFAGTTLAATITFLFIDPATGEFTDVDGDGRLDVAFREIYYDPSWIWAIGQNIDVESIALHEAGHGLSQAHFGTIRIRNDGLLQATPWAVMNALYARPQQRLLGSDIGGHCGNWGQWPAN